MPPSCFSSARAEVRLGLPPATRDNGLTSGGASRRGGGEETEMEIVIAAVVVALGLAAGLVAAAHLLAKRVPGLAGSMRATATKPAEVPVRDENEALARSAEIGRQEERLVGREDALEQREAEVQRRAEKLAAREQEIESEREHLVRELERASGMSASQAKHHLLKELEEQIRHDSARLVRQIEQETKRDADRRVRNILSVVMQRLAAGHAAETTVSVVQLPADDMKGRIIGREGRNIRALEHPTGVDFIIDDTPNAVILSGFDGVRREVARMTLEKLLEDGRIHPARIEETFFHEGEGPHAVVGADLARRHGEPEAVAHAMEAHHNEVEPQTVEAVIVQAADALSGARPGARGESLEQYVKRLRDLEQLATRHDGVDKCYAMQAGREIRVMVQPNALDDDGAVLLSHEIAREIEQELEYPGQIKVTVIRESRATDYAK